MYSNNDHLECLCSYRDACRRDNRMAARLIRRSIARPGFTRFVCWLRGVTPEAYRETLDARVEHSRQELILAMHNIAWISHQMRKQQKGIDITIP